jgi:uncharacterized protein
MAKSKRLRSRRKVFDKRLLYTAVAIAFIAGLLSGAAIYLIISRQQQSQGQQLLLTEGENKTLSTKIVAVSSDGSGVISELNVELEKGSGRILVDTHTLVGFDFQYAERTAVNVAAEITGTALDDDGVGLKGVDVFFSVSVPTEQTVEIQAIDGPSAGAATTVSTIAAIENRKVKNNVIITGTVEDDHTIGLIGGVYAKAKAAHDNGATLFLVPKGQYVEVSKQVGPFSYTEYKPISYLQDYAQQQGWGLQIQEVSTIEEAANLMLE